MLNKLDRKKRIKDEFKFETDFGRRMQEYPQPKIVKREQLDQPEEPYLQKEVPSYLDIRKPGEIKRLDDSVAQSRYSYWYEKLKEYAPSAAVLAGLLALAYASSPDDTGRIIDMISKEVSNPGTFTVDEMKNPLEIMSDKYDQLAKDVYKEVTSEPPVKQLFKGIHAPTPETHKPYEAPSQEKIITVGNDQYKIKYA